MRVFGIDFTSAPRTAKPITCAVGWVQGETLRHERVDRWESFGLFEAWLETGGPWVAAVDFPLGLPRRLVEAWGWPDRWEEYVARVGGMTKAEFEARIGRYRDRQPPGDKHHLRETDRLAGSCSPMMLLGVPVGKMFFQGAPRLLRAGVGVTPCRPVDPERVVVEAYPALVARRLIGRTPYKNDRRASPERHAARERIVEALESASLQADYGVGVAMPKECRQGLVDDATGDSLDAVLAALQAAYYVRRPGAAIPATADPCEGWIVDPACRRCS